MANLANPPVLLDRQSYPTNADENNVFAGAAAFGTNASGAPTLYALDCNSGILAFSLVASNHTLPPTIFQQPVNPVRCSRLKRNVCRGRRWRSRPHVLPVVFQRDQSSLTGDQFLADPQQPSTSQQRKL